MLPGATKFREKPRQSLENAHVSVEFTKLDPNSMQRDQLEGTRESQLSSTASRNFVVPFAEPTLPRPDPQREHPIQVNLAKARVVTVESSLPAFDKRIATQDKRIADAIADLKTSHSRWTRTLTVGGSIAIIALLITLASIMWQATGEMRDVASREKEVVKSFKDQRAKDTDSIASVSRRLQLLERAVCSQVAKADTTKPLAPAFAALSCR
jgi:hypothetical protein